MKMKGKLLGFLSLLGLILISTQGLLGTYFQQDEWNGFGLVLQLEFMPIWNWFGMVTSQHAVPLTMLSWFLMYKIFGFQAPYYIWSAILLHTIASFLTYFLAVRLSGSKKVGILTAVLFALNSRAAQAFMHLAVYTATIPSTILIISFLILLDKLRKKLVLRPSNAIVLLIVFFLAVSFREDGMILPVLLPIYFFIFKREFFQRKNIGFFTVFYSGVLLYFIYRFSQQLHNSLALSITGLSYRNIFFYNALSLPFKTVVQNIIEGYDLFNLVWLHKQLVYAEFANQITINLMFTVVYDFAIFIVFNLLVWIFLFVTRSNKVSTYWNAIKFSIGWIVVASELLAVVGRTLNVVESRYLYLTSFPVLFIVSSTLVYVFRSPVKSVILQAGKRLFVIAVIMWMVVMSYKGIQALVSKYVYWSQARIHILSDLMRLYPTVPRDAIFYVTCLTHCTKNIDKFGVPNELVLPFTSGPGWIFMLQYAKNDEASFAPFFAYENGKQFLWDYAAEGYKKIGDRGFGYFISKPLLIEALRTNNLRPDIVIGLGYDDSNFSLRDISPSVREEIRHDIATMSGIMK